MKRKDLTEEDLVRMNIPARYWDVSFNEISSKKARDVIVRYGNKIDTMISNGIGMILSGNNGVGKTAAVVCLAKEFRRRYKSVFFIEASDLKRAVFSNEIFDDEESVWDRAKSVDVLILDDLGKGVKDSKGQGERLIDELIRARNARKLITFITTNISTMNQLNEELKESTVKTFKECMYYLKMEGPDRREEAQKKIVELMSVD